MVPRGIELAEEEAEEDEAIQSLALSLPRCYADFLGPDKAKLKVSESIRWVAISA